MKYIAVLLFVYMFCEHSSFSEPMFKETDKIHIGYAANLFNQFLGFSYSKQ